MTKKKKKSFWGRCWRWLRNIVLTLFLLSVFLVILYRFIPVSVTPLMLTRAMEYRKAGEKVSTKKEWIAIESISPNVIQAVVASEDNLFLLHNGFALDDIKIAVEEHKKGKRLRGASTISQQTAKNLFLWNGRSFFRKGLEAYFTILIELFWPKERIMEVYLNIIEMGKGIYGIEAAAQIYFHTTAEKLTKSQAALIAVCLPNPRQFSPVKPSAYILKRQNRIMDLMTKIGPVDLKQKKQDGKNDEKRPSIH